MHTTNKGEMVVATGSGTGQMQPKGIVKIGGQGQMWTQSPKLAHLNGARWTCEGEGNMARGTSLIYVDIQESG